MISKLLKKNEKGFTLMEMLIVVAIIAVLIAIAIPTFNESLNKARVATDEANIRSGYASTMAAVLTKNLGKDDTNAADETYILQNDGSVTLVTADDDGTANAYKCLGTVKDEDSAVTIAGQPVTKGDAVGKWAKGDTVQYTYTYETNKIVITIVTATAGG